MWCHGCRDDVAAEVSSTTGRARCAQCGDDLGTVRRPVTEHARDLLKQWSATVDRDGPGGLSLDSSSESAKSDAAATVEQARHRMLEHPRPERHEPAATVTGSIDEGCIAETPPLAEVVSLPMVDRVPSPVVTRVDPSHTAAAPPHFDVPASMATRPQKSGGFAHVLGQMLAYAGVLALTTGTSLVIWSYFAVEPEYAPTGWLVASGGQMLLFLGLTTIVTCGLEQANREIGARIDGLGERIAHLEEQISRAARPLQIDAGNPSAGRAPEPTRMSA